jgi:hypothetical protein
VSSVFWKLAGAKALGSEQAKLAEPAAQSIRMTKGRMSEG